MDKSIEFVNLNLQQDINLFDHIWVDPVKHFIMKAMFRYLAQGYI